MVEKLTIEEIELIQHAMGYLYSELPEYDSACDKLAAMWDEAHETEKSNCEVSNLSNT